MRPSRPGSVVTVISAVVGVVALLSALLKAGILIGQIETRQQLEPRLIKAEAAVETLEQQVDQLNWRDAYLHGEFPVPKE